jgi:hypothetical protein
VRLVWCVLAAASRNLTNLDQFETEALDPLEQCMKVGLVAHRAPKHGDRGLDLSVELVEGRGNGRADPTLDPELVPLRHHVLTLADDRVTTYHPA